MKMATLTATYWGLIADFGNSKTPTPLASANIGNGDPPPPLRHADVLNGWSLCTLFWLYRYVLYFVRSHKSLATVVDLQSGKLKNKNFQGSVGVHSTLLLSVNNPRVWDSLFNPVLKACPRANLIPQ